MNNGGVVYLNTLSGIVSRDPLTWSTKETMHSFFTLKTEKEEIPVNCDFLCYVRQGDRVDVEGEIKKEQPINANYGLQGRYLYAHGILDKTLELRFMRQ
jgi:hypothetical protein